MSKKLTDRQRYEYLQQQKEKQWEAKCRRCGACCGSIEGDPCEHLLQLDNGLFACSIYENRFGLHKTVSGREFYCVPIRNILHESWPGDECCGYKTKGIK
ncbi:MAG: hypothetical protein KC684_05975 [Candidatus Omnitrophica bacterium]|nr:hypothetical protein [Candidatus Omnitrophota bacterium]